MIFEDRIDAGRQLAEQVTLTQPENSLFLALPRGGVPLAAILSEYHGVPFDLIFAKKIGHPAHREYAIGAVAEGGQALIEDGQGISDEWLETEIQQIQADMKERRAFYQDLLEDHDLHGKHLVLVDDGIATGRTLFAAIEACKDQQPASISVAVPIIPKDTFEELQGLVDQVYYVQIPEIFKGAVGAYYQSFPQVSDEEVRDWLQKAKEAGAEEL